MVQKLIRLSLVLALCFQVPAFAQGGESRSGGPRKQIATIVFAGLAGAILGLSTLSFYGRPQDKLSNIAIGFAIGIISGTVYTTYQATTRPQSLYDSGVFESESWKKLGQVHSDELRFQQFTPQVAGYSWEF